MAPPGILTSGLGEVSMAPPGILTSGLGGVSMAPPGMLTSGLVGVSMAPPGILTLLLNHTPGYINDIRQRTVLNVTPRLY